MRPELVLNELSLEPYAADIPEGRKRIADLLDTVRAAASVGFSRVLRTKADIHGALLAPEYPLSRWRNDLGVDRDLRLYFTTVATRSPFLAELPGVQGDLLIRDFQLDGQDAEGLGVAFILEALAVSFPSAERWAAPEIQIRMNYLDDENLVFDDVRVLHASTSQHALGHREWLHAHLLESVLNGHDLWERRAELFPRLRFCGSVEDQLNGIGGGEPILSQIVKRLSEMNRYCESWNEGGFDANQLPCKTTPESASTLEKYGASRVFRCPDGIDRTFSWHVRLTPAARRIQFIADAVEKTILIGHIGPHLPI